MFARLLVALLTLALAIPAMAMPLCHATEASAASVAGHSGHAMTMPGDLAPKVPAKSNPRADAMCIGRIAPSTVRPPTVVARLFDRDIRAVVFVATGAPLGHGHAPAPQPAPAPEAPDHQHHAPMQDAPVDHSTMDHSTMDHGPHDAHATSDSPGAGSGTARLPATEGGMHGVHLSTGDWMVMAHGYAPPPIPRRPGRGATIMFSSRRWGC